MVQPVLLSTAIAKPLLTFVATQLLKFCHTCPFFCDHNSLRACVCVCVCGGGGGEPLCVYIYMWMTERVYFVSMCCVVCDLQVCVHERECMCIFVCVFVLCVTCKSVCMRVCVYFSECVCVVCDCVYVVCECVVCKCVCTLLQRIT